MNDKIKLCTFLLSFTQLSFVKADTTACIFDWAEAAAPSLISSSVKTENILYGDFTLRYYDQTQNALVVNEKTKELLFYDVSTYLKGEEELQIYPDQRISSIEVTVRKYLQDSDGNVAEGVNLYWKGNKIYSITTDEQTQNGEYPGWSKEVTAPIEISHSTPLYDDLYFISEDGLHEIISVVVNGEEIVPSELNANNTFADQMNLTWVDDVQKTRYVVQEPSNTVSVVGPERYWASISSCNKLGEPLEVLATSYENTHSEHAFSFIPPITEQPYWPAAAPALADFEQTGEMTLVISEAAPVAYTPTSDQKSGRIKFFAKDELGSWVDISDMLLDDNTGCILARKALVADFNNDERPDVFFLCVGSDFDDIGKWDGYTRLFEKNRILLSTPSGKYVNREVQTGYPYVYAHGGTAFDYDGDGNIDVISQDTDFESLDDEDQYGKTHLLLGDGEGNFRISNQLDSLFENCCYHQVEAIDLNDDGYIDLWGGDHIKRFENGVNGDRPWIILSENGELKSENKIYLPVDDFFFDPMDAIKIGKNLYTIFINHDNSKIPYYWGIAIQKLSLETYTAEIIYSHVGVYDVDCADYIAGSAYSWFPWLHYEDSFLMPRQSCSGIEVPIGAE